MVDLMQHARELGELTMMRESHAKQRIGEFAKSRKRGERTWADGVRLSHKAWLLVIKCFEKDLLPEGAMQLAGVSRSSAYRAYAAIREAVAARDQRVRSFEGAAWADFDQAAEVFAAAIYEDEERRKDFGRYLRARLRSGVSAKQVGAHATEALLRYELGGQPMFGPLVEALYSPKARAGSN